MSLTRMRTMDDSSPTTPQSVLHDQPFAKKFKHTLDSDEEDDEQVREKYDVLDPDGIEGEEDGDLRNEAEVRITPFNMKEELEEGHFDKEGMYIFDKDRDQVKDHWLDNIDWVKVEQRATAAKPVPDQPHDQHFDVNDCYRSILSLLQPGETVQQAIRRLGQSSTSSKNGKQQKASHDAGDDEAKISMKQKMLNLISLADQLISSGDMDAYERTYEQLTFRLSKSSPTASHGLDIFAEETAEPDDSVRWELRWSESDDAQVHGPFSNSAMMQWRDAGYFASGAFVRQVGKVGAAFHSTNRIDFDLYS